MEKRYCGICGEVEVVAPATRCADCEAAYQRGIIRISPDARKEMQRLGIKKPADYMKLAKRFGK
jgi:hypothetical protein